MLQAYNSRDTQRASVNREEPIIIPEKPVLNNELIVRCERQLSKNRFLKEFKLICNKEVPDWQKYGALYSSLATHIRLGGESKKDQEDEAIAASVSESAKTKKDALHCLELLFEVLSAYPSALLADLVYLLSKNNMMKTKNDVIENISGRMTTIVSDSL